MNALTKALQMLLVLQESRGIKHEPLMLEAVALNAAKETESGLLPEAPG